MPATITPIPHTLSWFDAEFNFNFGCWQIKILCFIRITKCRARNTRCCKVDIWNPWLTRDFYVTFCSRTDSVLLTETLRTMLVSPYHSENSTTVLQRVLASTTLRTPKLYFSDGQSELHSAEPYLNRHLDCFYNILIKSSPSCVASSERHTHFIISRLFIVRPRKWLCLQVFRTKFSTCFSASKHLKLQHTCPFNATTCSAGLAAITEQLLYIFALAPFDAALQATNKSLWRYHVQFAQVLRPSNRLGRSFICQT